MGQGRREAGGSEGEGENGRGGLAWEPAGRREGGRAGGETTGPLGGDVPGYSIGRRRRGGGRTPIRFRTYNIRNGQNCGLELALRGVGQSNVDVGVFQETKLTDGIYTRILAGYKVVAMPLPS